jgi:hypothetical protein
MQGKSYRQEEVSPPSTKVEIETGVGSRRRSRRGDRDGTGSGSGGGVRGAVKGAVMGGGAGAAWKGIEEIVVVGENSTRARKKIRIRL